MELLLNILLQETALPTNIWTVGGALALFATVIAYLFKLFANSQESRFSDMKTTFENRLQQMQKDLDDEKLARRGLQDKFDNVITNHLSEASITMKRVDHALSRIEQKL